MFRWRGSAWWWGVASALAAFAALATRPALAAAPDATELIRIDYRAESGCPTSDEFNAQVFRRTTSARLATGGDTARTFIVSIERRGDSLVGSLVVRQTDGTTESREVAGPDCGEVATVLALATALAIDPQASIVPAPEPTEPVAPEPPKPTPPPAEHEPDDDEPAGSDEGDARIVLAFGPTLEAGVTPRLAWGGSAALGWRSPSGKGAISALGVDVTYLRSGNHAVGTAATSFQLLYARPALCSVAIQWALGSGIAPCVGGELGSVTGAGSNIAHARTRSRIWATVDMGLRLHQALGDVWFVEAEASVVLPVTRYHYVFRDPNTRVFNVPSSAFAGGLRLGARLW